MDQVEITALMLYYGRRNLAEEAVESFRRQTYPHKLLVIVNTHPDPIWFEDEHLDIEVHNLQTDSFASLNEKYNYAFRQIKTNWWCPWETDDIWLPWHLENLVENVPNLKESPFPGKVGVRKSYFAGDNVINRVGWNLWTACIFETFDKEGHLYPSCDETSTDNPDKQITMRKQWNRYWLDLKKFPLSFIFRWDQGPHASAVIGEKAVDHQRRLQAKQNAIRTPEPFRPHWDRDYVQDVKDFSERQNQNQRNNA